MAAFYGAVMVVNVIVGMSGTVVVWWQVGTMSGQ